MGTKKSANNQRLPLFSITRGCLERISNDCSHLNWTVIQDIKMKSTGMNLRLVDTSIEI